MNDKNGARFLRLAVVRNVLAQDLITVDDALELLRGCLQPGDESTRVDDTALLDMSVEEVVAVLEKEETEIDY